MLLNKNIDNFGSDGWSAGFLLLSFPVVKYCPSIFIYPSSKAGETGYRKLTLKLKECRYVPGKIL
tara:strand:+ start:209 stop:403 length:195 start_codon:yes stop_codon:yes gene_type:complete